jgi:hypothetical protein
VTRSRATGSCPRCCAPVIVAITEARSHQLLQPDPDPGGNTAAYRDGAGTWHARRPTTELPLLAYEHLHLPHYAASPACRPGATPGRSPRARPPRPQYVPPSQLSITDYPRQNP